MGTGRRRHLPVVLEAGPADCATSTSSTSPSSPRPCAAGHMPTTTAPSCLRAADFLLARSLNAFIERAYSAVGVGIARAAIAASVAAATASRSTTATRAPSSSCRASTLSPSSAESAFYDARVDDSRLVIDLVTAPGLPRGARGPEDPGHLLHHRRGGRRRRHPQGPRDR